MLIDFGYIGLFLVAAGLLATVTILVPIVLRLIGLVPQKPNPVKNASFECGMPTIGKTLVRFNFRYYFYALVFLALDILVIFLYPWAANLRDLGISAFIIMVVFIVITVVAYLYAWKKKVLEWK
ncbi:MAG: NADH-quinone oxidoreductase subunit [Chloroflexi bacterium]|nr:NADH-quinone oxidoreductase subunit [Chloroflexota bacterium]